MSCGNMPNHMFTGASIGTISGGTFVNHSEKSALDKLSTGAAHTALHDAPARTDETRCHQRTRTNVLDHLERWAQGICDEGVSIIWLHGGAGAGKSAIMQTLAERCVAQRLALGSFFFFRSDPTRNSAEVLIPTLVYQLAQLFPQAIPVVDPIFNGDPLIFKKSFQVQILNLLLPALRHLVHLGIISDAPHSPRVFLIDGLDECSDPVQQRAIIRAVAAVCHEYRIPVKFLIASRPELAISTSFEWFSQENRVLGAISLSEDADAEDDIHQYIEDEFLKIRLQHPFRKMVPSEWPDHYDVMSLVWKSSSHFIYASTAMKYIWSTKENPTRSLQVIIGLEVSRTISPFPELDALYHHILGSAAHCSKVLQILAHCIYMEHLSPTASIVSLVLNCSKEDLFIYVADISPLLVISQAPDDENLTLKVLHASFGDFLGDQSRSEFLHVNKQVYLASKLDRCFQLLELCSQQQLTTPDWNAADSDYGVLYYSRTSLIKQIITTIEQAGHLLAIEEVLKRYSLRDFYQWQLRFRPYYHYWNRIELDYVPDPSLSLFLIVVHWMETPNAVSLFQTFAVDFFDILESYINLESTPLAPAIVTLAYSGYPTSAVKQILHSHFYQKPLDRLLSVDTERYIFRDLLSSDMYTPDFGKPKSILDIMALVDPASVHRSINTSPKRLAAAAEAMLEYLTDPVNLQFLSIHPTHKSWLQWTKPGKHISTGTPRLASSFHKLWSDSLRLLQHRVHFNRSRHWYNDTPLPNKQLSPMVLGPKYRTLGELDGMEQKVGTVVTFLEVLLFLLPKAGFSQKIVLYSKRTFPWKIYERNIRLCRRLRKSLDEYANRVQNEKLEGLGHRIANGDANALIEKSRTLDLDAQD